jgi:xanthine dehydrogenase accessory factor
MRDPYIEIAGYLEKGKALVLARIIRQAGSAPRGVGTKCLVLMDGAIVGTIGGGMLEHLVSQAAVQSLAQGGPRILHFKLQGEDVAKTDMLCGGIVDVFLDPIEPTDPVCRELFQRLREAKVAGSGGVLITRVVQGGDPSRPWTRMFLRWEEIPQELPPELKGVWERLPKTRPLLVEGEGPDPVFWEPIVQEEVLYLFGAGHISTFVAPLAQMVGFKVVVIDDRQEFANRDRFPSAEEVLVLSPQQAMGRVRLDSGSYVAIITRGHIHDASVLREVVRSGAAYIGMIGSRRKRAVVYRALMEEGVPRETLERVHCPIGLDIGAETPEEIAVSIVAELIQVRARAQGLGSRMGEAAG